MDELGLGIKIDEEVWIIEGEKKKLRTINSKRRRRT